MDVVPDLWGEVYLITGMILDGIKQVAPSREAVSKNIITGMRKGMAYSGILVGFMYALKMILDANAVKSFTNSFPLIVGVIAGALVFPLLKTIIETFDGSIPFFQRARYSYRDGTLYARGAVAGAPRRSQKARPRGWFWSQGLSEMIQSPYLPP